MKLISISMIGYRQFLDRSEVQFPKGMTGICGPNGVGKSKLIEAIGFALYGPRTQILPAGDKREFIPSAAADRPQTEVVLTIEVRGERYVITRTLTKAEIRLTGAEDVLATTPKGVTDFVTRLLRLSAEAFVGTFVARQNEVAKLHTLDKKPRVDLIHRLIGISQLQKAIELAEKDVEQQRQEARRAEGTLTTTSGMMEAEIAAHEEGVEYVIADEKKVVLELEACTKELQQKKAILEAVSKKQDQKDSKGRELDLLKTSYQQTLSRRNSLFVDWQRADTALLRQTTINFELAGLTDAEAQFQHCEAMSTRELILEKQQGLRDQLVNDLRPAHELLSRTQVDQHALGKETEPVVEEIAATKTKKTLAAHCKSQAQNNQAAFKDKRIRMVAIGLGGTCENCGMTLEETSYQVALESCDQSIQQYEIEREKAAQQEAELTEHLALLGQKHGELQSRKAKIDTQLAQLAAVPAQIEAIERSLGECDEQLTTFGASPAVPFSQQKYDNAKEKLTLKNALMSELSGVSVLAKEEERYRSELAESENWIKQLDVQIQDLTDIIQSLVSDDAFDQTAKEAFQSVEQRQRLLQQKERDALQYRVQAEMRLAERRQQLAKIKSDEMRLSLLRLKQLTAERTLELLRQMLTEINDEARPRLAELMDTWLRSLIGEKFQGVTLSEDYRVQANCGAGFRLLDHFSGGEQTLLSVILRVAISLFCQERAGFDTSFLILDEVFGNQDEMHRNHLVNFLLEIQDHYHQILIVNHVEDVTQMLDTIIEVVPVTLNTSRIKMNTAII